MATALLAVCLTATPGTAQELTYRGFSEARVILYPQITPRDSDRVSLEGHARVETGYRPVHWLTFSSSFDARMDNLEQVERSWRVDFRDRTLQRPALSIRQASATLRGRGFTADVGKQFIRWGKADILTPTDRFAPRDFLEVTDAEFLAVTGVRLQYTRGAHSVDFVAVPVFTPSRIPLLDRRWAAVPGDVDASLLAHIPRPFPGRAQYGARWNLNEPGYEMSLSFFDGLNHLPEFGAAVTYAPLRMAGGDAAVLFPWFTLKGEAAYLKTTSAISDDVVMYVIQLERQTGELNLTGGYAGEAITNHRSVFNFFPDRGLTRAFLGRASYTIDTNRSVAAEAAVRQTGKGVWVKLEYSQARGAHWRTTINGTVIGGSKTDFLGQYDRNSHLLATLRYSF